MDRFGYDIFDEDYDSNVLKRRSYDEYSHSNVKRNKFAITQNNNRGKLSFTSPEDAYDYSKKNICQ